MASPGLALSGFTNLDQEFAPESSYPLSVPGPETTPAATQVQTPSIAVPHDTVTLSAAGSHRATYQPAGTSAAASISDAASFPPVRADRAASAIPPARNSEGSQSSTKSGDQSTATSATKPSPKPTAAPRESDDAAQNDAYQAATHTTQQSLLQLNRTLQQIGVNPQHASLIRRVALVRLANDAPALGEYFGPPSSIATATPRSSRPSQSASPTPSESHATAETPKTASGATHQKFVAQGKLLNVSV